MIHALVRAWALGLVRLYYPRRGVGGRDRLPAAGPAIVVANHPNGLLDPLVVRLAVGQPVAFLAKSTFWDNPLWRLPMAAFGALPVYRAHEADTRQNERTFAACRALLRAGGWLALFPEGKSHDATTLQPLKTGAARIAFGARREGAEGLRIVPVGLLFDDKSTFRSGVVAAVGEPLLVPDGDPEDRAAVDALTDRIAEALATVVLEAEDAELWRAFLAVAHWTGAVDLAQREATARAYAARWRALVAEDPEAADAFAGEVRRYARALRAVGVRDPFAIEQAEPVGEVAGAGALVALAPAALVGAILAWVPYRLVRPLAARIAGGQADVLGTVKLLAGFVVLAPVYLGWAGLAAWAGGAVAGLAALVLGPLTGWAALVWDEQATLRREALRGISLRLFRPRLALALAERRRLLVDRVRAQVGDARAGS